MNTYTQEQIAEFFAEAEALNGEYGEQEVFRADELDRVLTAAERIYAWIIAPPADEAEQ